MSKKVRYHKCCQCGNKATWLYMPSGRGKVFYCDEHVHRGCHCNDYDLDFDGEPDKNKKVVWWNETDTSRQPPFSTDRKADSTIYQYLDENGRLYPCCEYDYDENGFEFIPRVTLINIAELRQAIKKTTQEMYSMAPKKVDVNRLAKMAGQPLMAQNSPKYKGIVDYNWYIRQIKGLYSTSFHNPLAHAFYTQLHNKIVHHKFTMYEEDWRKN